MASLINENTQFLDTDGKPIVNGSLYIGQKGADPEVSPITIYSDRALTTPLANPQTLDSFGRSTNKVWVPGQYSEKVNNSAGTQKHIDLDKGEVASSGITTLTNVQGTNAITAEAVPAITAYVDREIYVLTVANANTGTVTLDAGGGAKAVRKYQNQALGAGDLAQDESIAVIYNGTADVFNLLSAPEQSVWLNSTLTPTFVDTKTFTLTGDQTAEYHPGRRIRVTDSGGDKFGAIESSVFTSLTTIAVSLDSGTIDSGISAIAIGESPATDSATPGSLLLARESLITDTEVTFTIPAWATQVVIGLNGVSADGIAVMFMRMGDSGGLETTGYEGAGNGLGASANTFTLSTAIFLSNSEADADVFDGSVVFELIDPDTNTWSYTGMISDEPNNNVNLIAGTKSLSGPLTTIEFDAGSGDTFDGGVASCRVRM